MPRERRISFSGVKELVRGKGKIDLGAADWGRGVENQRKLEFVNGVAPEPLQVLKLPQVSSKRVTFCTVMSDVHNVVTCTPDIVTVDEGQRLARFIEIKARGQHIQDDNVQASFGICTGTDYYAGQEEGLYKGEWKFQYFFYYDKTETILETGREFWEIMGEPFVQMCRATSQYLISFAEEDLDLIKKYYSTICEENY